MDKVTGKLEHGLKVGEKSYKNFSLEEIKTAKDLREIDLKATGQGQMAYDMHRAAMQITFSDDEGKPLALPITIELIDKLPPRDWVLIRNKQIVLDNELYRTPEEDKGKAGKSPIPDQ